MSPRHIPATQAELARIGLLAEVPTLARKVLTGMARRLHEADSKIVY